MNKLFFRRVLAFFVDYAIIIMYALLLFLASTLLKNHFNVDLNFGSPIKNQLLSFFLLTLPVFLYFYLSEKGIHKATLGKRFLKLKIASKTNEKEHLFLRNLLKFLPWEIAHIGVYHIVFYNNLQEETPIWVWCTLIIPQVIVLMYFLSVILSKENRSVYDVISNTEVSSRSY
jgi:uncharacterized RDD family membrane protein YckC